jgi:hypothetical protein
MMNVLTRVMIWGLLFCFPVAANADEQSRSQADRHRQSLEVGIGLICNSEAQVERYLALHVEDESPEAAIKTVNAEVQDPNACALAAIAFVRGEQGKSVPAPGGQMKITQVMILATQTPAGWQRVPPIVQYTAIFEKLEEA